ncbi:hypothetical protein Q1695_009823 [Nippostrongylus brasiliensis]|nr:hypothetical protein Q1695_009823 [Nippostrongylus brasiliensis]
MYSTVPSTNTIFVYPLRARKGEGQRSVEHVVTTDVAVYDCRNVIVLQWNSAPGQSCIGGNVRIRSTGGKELI